MTTLKLYNQVIAIFDKLDSDKRADLIATIRTHYCLRCGKHQPAISRCGCLNPEVNMIPAAKVEKHTGQLKDMAIMVWLDKQPPEGTILYMKN
jgi:hypothetical protein